MLFFLSFWGHLKHFELNFSQVWKSLWMRRQDTAWGHDCVRVLVCACLRMGVCVRLSIGEMSDTFWYCLIQGTVKRRSTYFKGIELQPLPIPLHGHFSPRVHGKNRARIDVKGWGSKYLAKDFPSILASFLLIIREENWIAVDTELSWNAIALSSTEGVD